MSFPRAKSELNFDFLKWENMLYKALFLYNLEPSLLIQTVHTKQTSFSIPNKNYWFWLFLSTSFQTFLFLFSSLPNHQDSSKLYPEGGNLKVKESILWPSTIFEYKKYNYQTLKVYTIGWGHHGSEMEITIQTTLCQKPKYKKKNKGKEKHTELTCYFFIKHGAPLKFWV